jgi:hypothetical protein
MNYLSFRFAAKQQQRQQNTFLLESARSSWKQLAAPEVQTRMTIYIRVEITFLSFFFLNLFYFIKFEMSIE